MWASGLDKPASEPYLDQMRASIEYYFNLAKEIAQSKDDKRSFLVGSVGLRNDGVMVGAPNAPTPEPVRTAHSEWRISRKLDRHSVIYIVRILRKNNQFAISRPCPDCQKILTSKQVKKVFYTNLGIGVWLLVSS